jgi:hypothetical protein
MNTMQEYYRSHRPRKIGVGIAPSGMLAWTDGETYIYFNRDYLAKFDINLKGLMELGYTMLHELCHEGPDTGTHVHSQEFYERFHDNAGLVAEFTSRAFANLEKWVASEDKKLSKKLLRERDRYEGILKAKEVLKLSSDALYDGIDQKTPEEALAELEQTLPDLNAIVLPEEQPAEPEPAVGGFFLE